MRKVLIQLWKRSIYRHKEREKKIKSSDNDFGDHYNERNFKIEFILVNFPRRRNNNICDLSKYVN